jgi:hypothetical protein
VSELKIRSTQGSGQGLSLFGYPILIYLPCRYKDPIKPIIIFLPCRYRRSIKPTHIFLPCRYVSSTRAARLKQSWLASICFSALPLQIKTGLCYDNYDKNDQKRRYIS